MRLTPIQGTILFFVLAPGTVAGLIPWAITGWSFEPAFLGNDATRFVGAAMIFAALDIAIDSFVRFAVTGKGTPSPTNPTETLVVVGFYRHVRNPIYVAVLAAILGQSALFGSDRLLVYAAAVFAVFHAFVVLYEEPTLARSFPDAYKAYRAAVPRWLPRVTPWQPSQV